MACLVSALLKCTLVMMLVFHLGEVAGKPAIADDYDAIEIGVDQELAVEEKLDPRVICKLPMKRGNCRALLLRWRYNPATEECEEFNYGGCSGNANNFASRKQCIKMCTGF